MARRVSPCRQTVARETPASFAIRSSRSAAQPSSWSSLAATASRSWSTAPGPFWMRQPVSCYDDVCLKRTERVMARVTISWQDPDGARPARDVVVRLTALTDRAFGAGDISAYLMQPGPGNAWVWTADLPCDLRT